MKEYELTKQSSATWLGMIPEHWGCLKIGSLFDQRKTKVSDKVFAPLSVTKMGILPQLENAAKSNDSDNRKLVRAGDFVINSRSDRKGSCGMSKLDGSVSLINLVLTPRDDWDNRYIHYLLRSQPFSEEYYRYGRGIVADLWTTRFSEMKNILLPIPPKKEQEHIASYLDWKISEINKIIMLRKKQIERLDEVKQKCITDIITCGTSSSVKMKDSGVEWIGNIPEHWDLIPFKYVLSERSEKNNPVKSTERLSLSIGLGVTLYSEKTTNLDRFKEDFSQYQLAHEGDLVMNSMNVIVGAVGVSKYYGCVSPAYYCYYDRQEDHVTAKYCEYIFLTRGMRNVLFRLGKGIIAFVKEDGRVNTCRLKVSKTDLNRLLIPIPPVDEQREIVSHLDKISNSINAAIINKQQQIQTMQELKKRLIADAVTGKIDVRDVTIPEHEYVEDEEFNNSGDDELLEDTMIQEE